MKDIKRFQGPSHLVVFHRDTKGTARSQFVCCVFFCFVIELGRTFRSDRGNKGKHKEKTAVGALKGVARPATRSITNAPHLTNKSSITRKATKIEILIKTGDKNPNWSARVSWKRVFYHTSYFVLIN
jgi:hypothetical protein